GFVAGVGGAVYAHGLPSLSRMVFSSAFTGSGDLAVVTMAVVGGISLLSGPLLGCFLVLGLPTFVHLDAAGLAASQFGLLVLILYVPRGVVQAVQPIRDRLAGWLAARAGVDVATAWAEERARVSNRTR